MYVLFWTALALLFYAYFGYGLLLFFLSAFVRRAPAVESFPLPAVTLVVPAYNEEECIRVKIENSLRLSYPTGRLFFLFITDGSVDGTADVVGEYPQIVHLHQSERQGKSAALNRAMLQVQTPIVVFSDANALLAEESIEKLVRHYQDEKVGGVSGEKRIWDKDKDTAVGFGERLYWKYESLLKKAESRFYTVIGAAGELFSVRSNLYQPLSNNIILDDFVVSANVCTHGYRFVYDAEAYAVEPSSETMAEEQKRKIRISAGCFQALALFAPLLNPFKNSKLAFQFFSHRVLRWAVCPLLLPLLLASNGVLAVQAGGLYKIFFLSQCFFYCLAFAGYALSFKKRIGGIIMVPYYFVFMHFSVYKGFYRAVTQTQSALWEKARRRSWLQTKL